jgi:hypothetical protein
VNSFTTHGFVEGRGTFGSALTVFDDPIFGADGAITTCACVAQKAVMSDRTAGAILSRATGANEILSKSGLLRRNTGVRQDWSRREMFGISLGKA